MKKILLHICCGVCGLASIEDLKAKGYNVSGFFFNPNIAPEGEYQRRLKATEAAAAISNIELISGEYNSKEWFKTCGPYKGEDEGGFRCELCYEFRLKETAKLVEEKGFDYFTTTLTISPHKNSALIARIGKKISRDSFLEVDFKKKDGFKKSLRLAKEHNLYRQNYCGCIYSKK